MADFFIEQICVSLELTDQNLVKLHVVELKLDTSLEVIESEQCMALGIALGDCRVQLPPDPQHHGAFGAAVVFSSCTVQCMIDAVMSPQRVPLQSATVRVCGLSLSLQPVGPEGGTAHEVSL